MTTANWIECPHCEGRRRRVVSRGSYYQPPEIEVCPVCNGDGMVREEMPGAKRITCPDCLGHPHTHGFNDDDRECMTCNGEGEVDAEFAQKIEDGQGQLGVCDRCGAWAMVVRVPGLGWDEEICGRCYGREEEPEPLDEEDLAFAEHAIGL